MECEEAFYTALSDIESWGSDSPRRSHIYTGSARIWNPFSSCVDALLTCLLCSAPYFCGIVTFQEYSIILIAIAFTWFHICLALVMCFHPVDYRGFKFRSLVIGWQGIVPSKALKMARKSCELIVDRLIYVNDIVCILNKIQWVDFLDSTGYYAVLEEAVTTALVKNFLPRAPRQLVRFALSNARSLSRSVTDRFISELVILLQDRSFFDVRDLITRAFTEDRRLLVNLFTQVGTNELKFIEQSGICMGLVCGLSQMLMYNYFASETDEFTVNPYILFSVSGLLIGLITNWIALFVIFNPIDPIILFGGSRKSRLLTLHGLFLRRQDEASQVYAKIVTETVLNVDSVVKFLKDEGKWNIIESLLKRVLREEISSAVSYSFLNRSQKQAIVETVALATEQEMEAHMHLIKDKVAPFIEDHIRLRERLYAALSQLSCKEFDGILHPVFKEDEPILIALGGVLGAAVGVLQVYWFGL